MAYVADRRLYSQDLFIGAHPSTSPLAARLHRDRLGEHLRPQPVPPADARGARDVRARTSRSSTSRRSRPTPPPRAPGRGTAILVHLQRMEIIIVGTMYAGEIKKSAFTVMNYLMPDEGVLPMHSVDQRRRARRLGRVLRPLGDRQDDPVGRSRCGASSATTSTAGAATTSSTSRVAATRRRSASRRCTSPTSSRRRALRDDPRERRHRPGHPRARPRLGAVHREHPRRLPAALHRQRRPDGHRRARPRNVVFLTADAFGVLPPISRLTREQAAYHFISGYTAKLAGTEIGVKEPTATFSAGFGAPFLPRHPGVYAHMLDGPPGALRRARLAREHGLDGRPVRRPASG